METTSDQFAADIIDRLMAGGSAILLIVLAIIAYCYWRTR